MMWNVWYRREIHISGKQIKIYSCIVNLPNFIFIMDGFDCMQQMEVSQRAAQSSGWHTLIR